MIRTGDTLQNPVTRETLTFLKAACDTGGEYTLVECYGRARRLRRGGARPPVPDRDVRARLGHARHPGRPARSSSSSRATSRSSSRGTPHKFWNAGDDRAVFRARSGRRSSSSR